MSMRLGDELRVHKKKGTQLIGVAASPAGSLTLSSTFDSISVIRSLANGGTASLQYKTSISSTWLDADTPIFDDRATVGGGANAYQNQYRASIVGLAAGTSYDVRMIVAGSTYQSSVTTLASTVTNGGTTRTVTPANIATHLLDAVPGDIIDMTDGTYSAFTFSTSGTENAWISFVGRNRDACFIDAGDPNLTINANYIQLKNLRFKKPTTPGAGDSTSALFVNPSKHHVWTDNLYFEDLPLPSDGTSYGNTLFFVSSGCHHVYCLNSTFLCPSLVGKPDRDFNVGGFGFATGTLDAEGTIVIKGCTFTGKFQDAIGSDESVGGNQWNNSDVANNMVSGYTDDGIQCEGDTINCRIWGNTVTCGNGYSCIAQESGYVGPSYIFRNTLTITGSGATGVFKMGSTYGNAFPVLYHNSIDTQATSSSVFAAGTSYAIRAKNNIFRATNADIIEGMAATPAANSTFDYNLYYRNTGTRLISNWNGNDYNTPISNFFSATGQEEHGVGSSDPLYINAALQINSSSPAYRTGINLPNFNDANSTWPAVVAGSPSRGNHEAS